MKYVALINSVREKNMSLSDAFIPINKCTAVVLAMYLSEPNAMPVIVQFNTIIVPNGAG